MDFQTNQEMVDYINERLPQSFNDAGFILKARVWKGIGTNITIDLDADPRGLQAIGHNNRFHLCWMQHGCPESGAYDNVYCFMRAMGFPRWTCIKNPIHRKQKSFRAASVSIIKYFVKNEAKIWECINESK